MPAKSDKQRRWAFATHGEAWAKRHHFDKVEGQDDKSKARNARAAKRRIAKRKRVGSY